MSASASSVSSPLEDVNIFNCQGENKSTFVVLLMFTEARCLIDVKDVNYLEKSGIEGIDMNMCREMIPAQRFLRGASTRLNIKRDNSYEENCLERILILLPW